MNPKSHQPTTRYHPSGEATPTLGQRHGKCICEQLASLSLQAPYQGQQRQCEQLALLSLQAPYLYM